VSKQSFPDFSIESEFEVEAYAKWFLRLPLDSFENEFSPAEWKTFLTRRELRLKAELDELVHLNFRSPNSCNFVNKHLFKIVKKAYSNPLSSEGAYVRSSRFNYKNIPQMQNRIIYFSQDKQCCVSELFHLDIQKHCCPVRSRA
jgi:hypothetical protein